METEIEKKIKEIAKIAPGKRGFCFWRNLGIIKYSGRGKKHARFKIFGKIF